MLDFSSAVVDIRALMASTTVAFFAIPEYGHVNATFGLAKKLRERGHRVAYLCPIPKIKEHVRSNGFDILSLPDPLEEEAAYAFSMFGAADQFSLRIGKNWRDRLKQVRGVVARLKRTFATCLAGPALADTFRTAGIDLLLVDAMFTPPAMVGHSLGIPTLLLSTTLPSMRLDGVPPLDRGMIPDHTVLSKLLIRGAWYYHFARRRAWAPVVSVLSMLDLELGDEAMLRRAAEHWGFKDRIDFDSALQYGPNLPLPNLVLCSRELDFDNVIHENLFYIGPNIDFLRSDVSFPWDRLDPGKRLVYCSLGTVGRQSSRRQSFFERVIEAFRNRDDVQLVMAVGPVIPVSAFSAPPSTVIVQHAPQVEILRRAAVMVTHGGFNTIKELISVQVPCVVFPITFDQPGTGARVRFHKLGLTGDLDKATSEQIEDLVDSVLADSETRRRLQRMQAIFQRDDASDLALRTIDELVPSLKHRQESRAES